MFTNKNLNHSTRNGLSFLKGATFFFLGMSLVLFAAKAFEITPIATNFQQVIQKIILTHNGSIFGTTGVVIDGAQKRVQSDRVCNTDGTNCKWVADLLTGAALSGYLPATGTNGQWCIYSGSKIECFQSAPSGGVP